METIEFAIEIAIGIFAGYCCCYFICMKAVKMTPEEVVKEWLKIMGGREQSYGRKNILLGL